MKAKLLLLISMFAIGFLSCKKETELTKPIDLTLNLSVDPAQISFPVPYEKATVEIVNKTNNEKYTVKPTSDGQVVFTGIVPGTYSVNVSMTLTAAEFTELSGIARAEDYHLNYSIDNQSYFESSSLDLKLITSEVIGGFVFKQIYYVGSNTKDGALFRDLFVEIYNNSNTALYADSLCFALVIGKNNTTPSDFLLPNLQFDWSKSIGMVGENANTDYLYAKGIFMIPSDGSGKKYLVQPGQSLIIAGTAVDHTKPYVLNSGKEQAIGNPTLTVDLSKADFEVYLYPYDLKLNPTATKFASDVDNPQVPDVETIFATGLSDLVLNPQGKESYILFKSGGKSDPNQFPKFPNPETRTVTASTVKYPQIPLSYVLDAVEVAAIIEKDKTPRRLPLKLDAGSISVDGGPYSSQSIIRKTKTTVNGRRILKDTNNSTADFGVLPKADPSKSASSFIN